MASNNYQHITVNGRVRLAHRVIAERVLGKPLPRKAQVHHVDGDRSNNVHSNLVICEDGAYHQLLHNRQRALDATGDASAVRCGDCGWWVKPETDHDAACRAKVGRTGGKPRGFAKFPLFLGRGKYDSRSRRTIPRKSQAEGDGKSAYANTFPNRDRTPE